MEKKLENLLFVIHLYKKIEMCYLDENVNDAGVISDIMNDYIKFHSVDLSQIHKIESHE